MTKLPTRRYVDGLGCDLHSGFAGGDWYVGYGAAGRIDVDTCDPTLVA